MKKPTTLTEADLDELDEFLLSDQTPEGCMDLSMLNGFLTSLVIGPKTIPSNQWLPVIWGETEDDEMVWESVEEASRILSLVMALLNSIGEVFQQNPQAYGPIILMTKDDEPIINDWCIGFLRGMALNPDPWEDMVSTPGQEMNLVPIMLHGSTAGLDLLESEELKEMSQKDWLSLMYEAVLRIHAFWLPHRKDQIEQMPPTSNEKVGRNDPCPCGSGKKFKHCCMK